ncbi:hypothetical protein JCM18904_3358 [Vibrio sp. JCM 18904]|nr:hypothetical protein JCM18904_3358 [Vibrio sp. JCM 18904]
MTFFKENESEAVAQSCRFFCLFMAKIRALDSILTKLFFVDKNDQRSRKIFLHAVISKPISKPYF